jgi:hypothetical protein
MREQFSGIALHDAPASMMGRFARATLRRPADQPCAAARDYERSEIDFGYLYGAVIAGSVVLRHVDATDPAGPTSRCERLFTTIGMSAAVLEEAASTSRDTPTMSVS